MKDFNYPITEHLKKGLAVTYNPRNVPFLVESIGAFPYEGKLQAIKEFERIDTSSLGALSFPYPQLFVFSDSILVCTQTKIYELVDNALVLKIENLPAGQTWSAVDFKTYIYLTNAMCVVEKNSQNGVYALNITLPFGMCVCNYNGQILLGSPNTPKPVIETKLPLIIMSVAKWMGGESYKMRIYEYQNTFWTLVYEGVKDWGYDAGIRNTPYISSYESDKWFWTLFITESHEYIGFPARMWAISKKSTSEVVETIYFDDVDGISGYTVGAPRCGAVYGANGYAAKLEVEYPDTDTEDQVLYVSTDYGVTFDKKVIRINPYIDQCIINPSDHWRMVVDDAGVTWIFIHEFKWTATEKCFWYLYKSTNYGETITLVKTFEETIDSHAQLVDIVVDSLNGKIVCASTHSYSAAPNFVSRIWVSDDYGATFTKKDLDTWPTYPYYNYPLLQVAVHGDVIIIFAIEKNDASTYDLHIRRSADFGTTWNTIKTWTDINTDSLHRRTLINSQNFFAVAYPPYRLIPGQYIISLSIDDGLTWEDMTLPVSYVDGWFNNDIGIAVLTQISEE